MSNCKYEEECSNFPKSCFQCFNYAHFQRPKERVGLRARSLTNAQKKEGLDFENKGTKKYNQAINQAKDLAHRQIGSGAFGGLLGDMITEEELTAAIAEFKERGSRDTRGRKQITIKKEWLEELREEARETRKEYYFLPFRFKEDDMEYVILEYDILLSYIQTIQSLLERVRLLESERE